MDEYYQLEVASDRAGDGQVSVWLAVEPDGCLCVNRTAEFPPIPDDPWSGVTKWLRLQPAGVRRLHAVLSGRMEPNAAAGALADLIMRRYRGSMDARDELVAICDRHGIEYDAGGWFESA